MPDINTVVVTPTVSVVAVNSSVPGSFDSVPRLSLGWVSVQEYGAVGDGSTDDATSIQNAITAAVAFGGTVVFPKTSSYYKVGTALNVTGACTLLGPGEVRTASGTIKVFNVTGSDVTFDGLRILGPSTAATTQSTGHGICVTGTSAASPATNIRIRDCYISGFSLYGILLEWVVGYDVSGNTVKECANSGIAVLSGLEGRVVRNYIDTIGSQGSTYGIAFSRRETNSIVTEPQSSDFVCIGNVVMNVRYWEGIDTHGGVRGVIADNLTMDCDLGINVGGSDNASQVTTWAPEDIVVRGNVCVSGVTDGTGDTGIRFSGASTTVLGSGSIIGNTVRNHGTDSASTSGNGAIRVRHTQGLVVSDNTVWNPSPVGFALVEYNTDFVLAGNTVIDPWSEISTAPALAVVTGTNNSGTMSGNRLSRGTKSATYVCAEGIRVSSATSVRLRFLNNDLVAATTALVNSGVVEFVGTESIKRTSVGDADVTLTVGQSSNVQVYADALTQNRTVTLSTTDAYDGAWFSILRSGLGSFTLNVGGLKTIPSATAATVDVVFRAGAWQLWRYTTL